MQFRLLGPLEVWDGEERIDLGGAKQRALLALLLLNANRTVRRIQVVDWLWDTAPPRTAGDLVHEYVSRLRRALRPCRTVEPSSPRLLTHGSGYVLRVEPDELDLDRFERLVDQAHQVMAAGDLELATGSLRQALGLWRGSALADLPPSLAVDAESARLEEARLTALEDRIEAELGVGRHAELVGELEALVSAQPLRERLRAQLMLALYRSGRQPEALAVYRAARRLLAADYGLEPGSRLRELEQAILCDEPALHNLTIGAGRSSAPPPPPQPIPHELPSSIAEFTGRTRELQLLTRHLDITDTTAGLPVVISAIDGMGGIGKSALAIQAANQLAERFPDGQLYVNLHGATPGQAPRSPLDALGQLLRSLGLDPAAIPAQVEEAAVRWRSLASGRRLLLLLDNARDAAQVRPLLPGSPTCAVVVTSRQVLGSLDARSLHLDLLAHEQALKLLGRIGGRHRVAAEPAAAAEVVDWCGRLPLAIRIAGARLAARPTWPLRELAERLADATRRLDELTIDGLAVRAALTSPFRPSGAALTRSTRGPRPRSGCSASPTAPTSRLPRRPGCSTSPSPPPRPCWSGWSTPTWWRRQGRAATASTTWCACMRASTSPGDTPYRGSGMP